MADVDQKQITVTLVRSMNGRLKNHKACVTGLGIHRLHQTVTVADTSENRGMINKISYMLNIEKD